MKTTMFKGMRSVYRSIKHPKFPGLDWCTDEEREHANRMIRELLMKDDPCFIGRIGTVEQSCVLNYLCIHENKSIVRKLAHYITDDVKLPWWEDNILYNISNNAGFFPANRIDLVSKFAELYLNDIPLLDVVGRFYYWERFMPFKKDVVNVQLETLYPFFVKSPWTEVIKGKKILVVHPFTSTIEAQYAKRDLLFEDKRMLPDFELKTIKAVQSIAGSKVPFNDWFEALEFMKEKIRTTDFDICILGCGAYGLPLGAFVKRLGKKAIHLGGGTQLLFGIKGKRWEVQYDHSCYRDMFNSHWVYPSQEEKPEGASKVEGACYW